MTNKEILEDIEKRHQKQVTRLLLCKKAHIDRGNTLMVFAVEKSLEAAAFRLIEARRTYGT